MRRMVLILMAGFLAAGIVGGCPGAEIPGWITILAAGTYTGTQNCTVTVTTPAGEQTDEAESPLEVVIGAEGQLTINGVPYYQGAAYEEPVPAFAATLTLTINSASETADTVNILGAGDMDSGTIHYDTTRTITLEKLSDTQIEFTDVFAGESDSDRSFEWTCAGTATR